MSRPRPAEPLRLRQVPDGWLLADDLRTTTQLPQARLARHHTAAHRSWGCSHGLVVSSPDGRQVSLSDGRLVVSPGVAVDRCGRLLELDHEWSGRVPASTAVWVVLHPVGDGPAARVRLWPQDRFPPDGVLLAHLDRTGTVHAGDGDRTWLRRPGPVRQLAGTVPRGAPVTGWAWLWTVHVDLTGYRLPDAPAVIAGPAGRPPVGACRSTVEVAGLTATGFDLVVRCHAPASGTVTLDRATTAPHALSWQGVLVAKPHHPTASTEPT